VSEAVRENEDGTVIVTLTMPVRLGKEETDRITMREVVVADVFEVDENGDIDTIKKIVGVAGRLASPKGVVDQIRCSADLQRVVEGAGVQVGKFRGTRRRGEALSASSGPDSASPEQSSAA
jgi:hypothetical protein